MLKNLEKYRVENFQSIIRLQVNLHSIFSTVS